MDITKLSGAEGIKKAYTELLQAKNLDIVCLSEDYGKVLGNWYDREFWPSLKEGFIRTREILPDTDGNRNDSKSKDPQVNAVRFIVTATPSESDMILTDDSLTLISFDTGNPGAVVITDSQIVTSLRLQYETMWKALE
jgi:hypothetical protein